MGEGDWFRTFCGNLTITNRTSIGNRYQTITKRLNTDFWGSNSATSHSLYVGSYGRNTAIKGISDLDMIFQLPYSEYKKYNEYSGNGQSALLQAVRTSLKKTYSTSSIGADGQVIVIKFDDDITFEIVPAFINDDDSFTFPNANNGGSWKKTDPKPEIKAIRDRNTACNDNLVPLCRMMRAWKKEWSVPMGGLLIDTLAYQFINTWPYRDKSCVYYDYMSRDFFYFMKNQDKSKTYWLAPGSGQYVWKKEDFQYKATRCYNISLEAIVHNGKGETWSAKKKWRDIFGTDFPS